MSRLSRSTIGGEMPDRDELLRLARSDPWVKPSVAAGILGVHRSTVHNMMADGRLRWRKLGGRKLRHVSSADVLSLADDE